MDRTSPHASSRHFNRILKTWLASWSKLMSVLDGVENISRVACSARNECAEFREVDTNALDISPILSATPPRIATIPI